MSKYLFTLEKKVLSGRKQKGNFWGRRAVGGDDLHMTRLVVVQGGPRAAAAQAAWPSYKQTTIVVYTPAEQPKPRSYQRRRF
jgi:hypothetical protein